MKRGENKGWKPSNIIYISNKTTSKSMSKALLEEKNTIHSILADVGITTYKHIYGGEK